MEQSLDDALEYPWRGNKTPLRRGVFRMAPSANLGSCSVLAGHHIEGVELVVLCPRDLDHSYVSYVIAHD